MTDQKISELPSLTNADVDDADLVPIVDSSAVTTKKITWGAAKAALNTFFSSLFLGADATTADVDDSTDRRYCTDAQKTVVSNTSGTNSGDETTTSIGALVSGASSLIPAASDEFAFSDVSASNVLTKVSLADLQATILDESWSNFTPTLSSSGTVPEYSASSGKYLILGNITYVQVYLSGDGGDEGSGLYGLKLHLPVLSSYSQLDSWHPAGVASNGSSWYNIICRIQGGATITDLWTWSGVNSLSTFQCAEQDNASRSLRLNFWYRS